jgi:hypothetical protein
MVTQDFQNTSTELYLLHCLMLILPLCGMLCAHTAVLTVSVSYMNYKARKENVMESMWTKGD